MATWPESSGLGSHPAISNMRSAFAACVSISPSSVLKSRLPSTVRPWLPPGCLNEPTSVSGVKLPILGLPPLFGLAGGLGCQLVLFEQGVVLACAVVARNSHHRFKQAAQNTANHRRLHAGRWRMISSMALGALLTRNSIFLRCNKKTVTLHRQRRNRSTAVHGLPGCRRVTRHPARHAQPGSQRDYASRQRNAWLYARKNYGQDFRAALASNVELHRAAKGPVQAKHGLTCRKALDPHTVDRKEFVLVTQPSCICRAAFFHRIPRVPASRNGSLTSHHPTTVSGR